MGEGVGHEPYHRAWLELHNLQQSVQFPEGRAVGADNRQNYCSHKFSHPGNLRCYKCVIGDESICIG